MPLNGEPIPSGSNGQPLESTATLLARIRSGDDAARGSLLGRYLPVLQRWAHGRLPSYARDLSVTDDLVQMTLLGALTHLEGFDARREGAFLAYLRQILLNKVRDEIRKTQRRPAREALADDLPGTNPSPLQLAIGTEMLERYESALERLPEGQREAVMLRVELDYSNEEIAQAVGSPTANAARMLVVRGLMKLAEEMDDARKH